MGSAELKPLNNRNIIQLRRHNLWCEEMGLAIALFSAVAKQATNFDTLCLLEQWQAKVGLLLSGFLDSDRVMCNGCTSRKSRLGAHNLPTKGVPSETLRIV
jgi:hypothetical protein